jgi:hypothetical protein
VIIKLEINCNPSPQYSASQHKSELKLKQKVVSFFYTQESCVSLY